MRCDLPVTAKKLLTRAKTLAAQHEAALKEKFGGERYRLLLETIAGVLAATRRKPFDRRGDTEQPMVLAIARDQHEPGRSLRRGA